MSWLSIVFQAFGATPNAASFECADYPPTFAREVNVGGKVGIKSWHRLPSGEIEANVAVTAKKLIADNPDANLMQFLTSLLAYNCRAIQQENLSPEAKSKAREKFNDSALRALFPKAPAPTARMTTNAVKIMPEKSELPSARLVAKQMLLAAKNLKGALDSTYSAALGGTYIPVVPYELMLDSFMLAGAAKQNMMQSVPNTKVYPADAATSIGFDICVGIRAAHEVTEKTFSVYGSKVPEIFYQDIENIQLTSLYKYFLPYISVRKCDIFQGEVNAARAKNDPMPANGLPAVYPIPLKSPVFSEREFSDYISAVKTFEDRSKLIVNSKVGLK